MSDRFTFATGTNATFLESVYEAFKADPSQVEDTWRKFFEGYEFALSKGSGLAGTSSTGEGQDHAKIEALINAYRRLGHLYAHLNPLNPKPEISQQLLPAGNGLGHVDTDHKFLAANFGGQEMTLDHIMEKLTSTYCGFIGADFREVNNIEAVVWLQEQMESCANNPVIASEQKTRILEKLAQAEGFERFLQARYLGQKRFSLEGLESLIPLLDTVIHEASGQDVDEIYLGMAHRGRLNVLANIMQKPYLHMLNEFEGSQVNPFDIDGDVKYHMGFSSTVINEQGKELNLFLSPNPSHLEAVNPVIEGFTRARQDSLGKRPENFLPVLLHGDASFIGQGIVAETMNLAYLKDYGTGGTIHVITNNQIGFTTDFSDSRSCIYSSDIAKVNRAPVFHVNADRPESVAWVAKLATRYRKKFKEDVVIDLIGYRKHGHNETDEPTFTQPQMYKKISKHPGVLSQYSEELIKEKILNREAVEAITKEVKDRLQKAYVDVKGLRGKPPRLPVPATFNKVFEYHKAGRDEVMGQVQTQVSSSTLLEISKKILSMPDSFNLHPKLKRIFQNRSKMLEGDGAIDWAFGELLAFGTLSSEKFRVRLSGQDCKRGTFSSRHGVLCDYITGEHFEPLSQIGGAPVTIINSPLSEQGCLGFEFGYSIANPDALVLWEAQFGDFVNGAQIIIDQFLSASEAKWQMTSGLVLLLPHGFEGMGPEHSSARPERFLQQCGNLNMQVCNVTTPAQHFHLLRRQMHRKFRKPLIIMTPKSLLRHPRVKSTVQDFTAHCFSEVIDDTSVSKPEEAEKIVICTGKLFYELTEIRSQYDYLLNTPVLRIEQLYPFPFEKLRTILKKRYPALKEIVWAQEEPQNMGAWSFVRPRLESLVEEAGGKASIRYVGRKHSGTTAEGSANAHKLEQNRILEEAFGLVCAWAPGEAERKYSRL